MLNALDESLEAFLRTEVPLPTKSIDISFEAPDSDWGAGVSRPTVNLYLWDLRLNAAESSAGPQLVEQEGKMIRRPPFPRLDARYLATAWTSDVRDEHALLGSVLAMLLGHKTLNEDYLRGPFVGLSPLPSIEVASPDMKNTSDFWSALGGQLKPGLDIRITTTVDSAAVQAAGPPVETYDVTTYDLENPDRESKRRLVGVAVDPKRSGELIVENGSSAVVGDDGRYVIEIAPED